MTLTAPLLSLVARIEGRVAERLRARLRTRRERASLRALFAMTDDRLHDLGLTREALRCGLAAREAPMRTMRLCRSPDPLERLRSSPPAQLRSLREDARWGERRVYPERHLGW